MKTQEEVALENSINHQIIESIKDQIMHSSQIMDAMDVNQSRINLVNADDDRYKEYLNGSIEKRLNGRSIEDVMTLGFERYQKICQLLFYK